MSILSSKSERQMIIFPQIGKAINDDLLLSQMQGYLKYVVNEKETIKALGTIKGLKQKKREDNKTKPIILTQVKIKRSPSKAYTTSINSSQPKIPINYHAKRNTIEGTCTCSNRLTTSLIKIVNNDFNKKFFQKKKATRKMNHNKKKLKLKALLESVSYVEQQSKKKFDLLSEELKTIQKKKYESANKQITLRSCSLDEIIFKENIANSNQNKKSNVNNIFNKLLTEQLNTKKVIFQSKQISNYSPADSYKYRKHLGRRMGYGIVEEEGEELIIGRRAEITKEYQTPKWVKEKIQKQRKDSKKLINLSGIVHKKYSLFMDKAIPKITIA